MSETEFGGYIQHDSASNKSPENDQIDGFEEPAKQGRKKPEDSEQDAWVVGEVTFPQGTKFRGKYKGYYYVAEVDKGSLILNGRQFSTPSSASLSITREPVDGWLFWECQLPDRSCWESIYGLRKAAQQV